MASNSIYCRPVIYVVHFSPIGTFQYIVSEVCKVYSSAAIVGLHTHIYIYILFRAWKNFFNACFGAVSASTASSYPHEANGKVLHPYLAFERFQRVERINDSSAYLLDFQCA